MKITDCVWEVANIGKRTCEVLIEKNDSIEGGFLEDISSKYEYQVVKVESGNIQANIILSRHGFHLIETQIDIELKYSDFNYNDPLVKFLEADTSFIDVEETKDFEAIFERMTPNMFVSDRVALDPCFGLEVGYKRYCNWMRTSFDNKTAQFFQMKYKGEHVGFSMYRVKDGIWHGDLGGVYPHYGNGLGLLTACGSFYYMKQRGLKIKKLVSAISSNNVPVIPTFNYCHYNFKNFKQVYVKHNNIEL